MKKLLCFSLLAFFVLNSCIKNFEPPETIPDGVTVEVRPCPFSFCVNLNGNQLFPDGRIVENENATCRITVYCYLGNELVANRTVYTDDMSSAQYVVFEDLSPLMEYNYIVVQDFAIVLPEYNYYTEGIWTHSNTQSFWDFRLDRNEIDSGVFDACATAIMTTSGNPIISPVSIGPFILVWFDNFPDNVASVKYYYDLSTGYICTADTSYDSRQYESTYERTDYSYTGFVDWFFFSRRDYGMPSTVIYWEALDASGNIVSSASHEVPLREYHYGGFVMRIDLQTGNMIDFYCLVDSMY